MLVLLNNRKSHMGFQLIPTSMIFNDLEWRNDRWCATSDEAEFYIYNYT